VAPTVAELARRGYTLAVASNFDGRLSAICDGRSELRSIGVHVISSLVGWRKPSAQFFESLVTSAGCLPRQVLMVGDEREHDVAAAQAVGLQAMHLVRGGGGGAGTIRELTELVEILPTAEIRSNQTRDTRV
jgi:putative hydrolase of the HAD superfamily